MRSRASMVAIALAVVGLLSACGGSPPDLGTVQPAEPIAGQPGPWKVVIIEGMTPSAARIEPVKVEVDPNGLAMTVFFQGGDPTCYTVAGVDVDRHDPAIPEVTVLYGLRFGNMGCNAAMAPLAIRVRLEPPFEG